jgi:hypothetical protein
MITHSPMPLLLLVPQGVINNCNAVGSTSDAVNDSNNHNAVSGSDDDIMSLSFTNQSLQPNVSASDSSSFIGPHHNLEQNAHLKVKR